MRERGRKMGLCSTSFPSGSSLKSATSPRSSGTEYRPLGVGPSSPNIYASEAECDKILGILNRLVARLHEVVQSMGGHTKLPARGGWSQFASAACGGSHTAAVVNDDDVETQVGAEASSSESSDDNFEDTSGA